MQVTHFNGERIANLLHLARLVDACTDRYMRFTTDACNKVTHVVYTHMPTQ